MFLKIVIKGVVVFVVLIFSAGLLTIGSTAFKRSNLPDCSKDQPTSNPYVGVSYCEVVRLDPQNSERFERKGWPYSFPASAPIDEASDSLENKIQQKDYDSYKRGSLIRNFTVYFMTSTTVLCIYLLIRKLRHANFRN